MSNQFYNYIASILNEFFMKSSMRAGERYYLQLDNQSEIFSLLKALMELPNQHFHYQHELGEKYTTFSIPYNDLQLVIANTSEEVKPDFLVTLRNLVGEQEGPWQNTALLSIVAEQLDSIQGGSSDLQKEGMPLHPSSLFNKLKSEIENSVMDKVDQIVLLDNLENLLKEQAFQQITIFEFEDIFTTLQKGSIDNNEYHKFGLFKDPELDKFKGKDLKRRLVENRELYDFVKKTHDFGLGKDELEKRFTSEGARELLAEQWSENLFPRVFKLHEDFNDDKKKKRIEIEEIEVSNRLTFWNRAHKDTTAGNKKRHILIFNQQSIEQIQVNIKFELSKNVKSLSKEYLSIQNQFKKHTEIDVKKSNIFATINCSRDEVTFTRITYKHDKKSQLGAELLIAVVPSIEPVFFDKYKSFYSIDPISERIGLMYEENTLTFGQGFNKKNIEVHSQNQQVDINSLEEEQVIVTPMVEAFDDNEELKLNLKVPKAIIPLMLKNEIPESMPITGQRLWKLIRETGKNVEWIEETNRLVLENREYYLHSEYKTFFEWERQWVQKEIKAGFFESDKLKSQYLNLNPSLLDVYNQFIHYFKRLNSLPSLTFVSEEYRQLGTNLVQEYINQIKTFKEGTAAGKKGSDLFKLGTLVTNDNFYLTPFHPLVVAFKLKMYELVEQEILDNSILNRLNSDALLPFIYDDKEQLHKPDHQQAAMEWLVFKPVSKVTVSDASQYLAKVIKDKISQFKDHFAYLFIENSRAPLQLNIINISNDREVVSGLLQWMIDEIERVGINHLANIEVTLYNDVASESAFDLYARAETVKDVKELFNLTIRTKEYDQEDILRKIRENLSFFKRNIDAEYKYAHISFYKMEAQEKHAVQPMSEMITGLALEGLYSSVPSMKDEENYKSGFGIKAYPIDNSNLLAQAAYYTNELTANMRNSGSDSYRKGEAIFSRTTSLDEKNLRKIYDASYWVTFIDPAFDLEYFNQQDSNLVVIHYSDQYSSSSRYDAITVTNKSGQYYSVIKDFLKKKEVKGTDENVLNTIKAFNTFNGEWLLRIIGSKGHYDREKLSIISAIKYAVSYLDHPNITWVPVSLEEVLRVAGAVSLSKSDGIFTAKNLGVKGSHSDDLLLIGLEKNDEKLLMHFYPIEVKIGFNKLDVIEKAKHQVNKTKSLFIDTLTGDVGDTFTGKFYRNFFAQLLISNAKKLKQSEFWNEKGYDFSLSEIELLLKDDYEVSNALASVIGEGAVLSFQKDVYHRSAKIDSNILLITLTEIDGYEGLVQPIEGLWKWIQKNDNDFVKEDMLSYKYRRVNDVTEIIEEKEDPEIIEEKEDIEVVDVSEDIEEQDPVDSQTKEVQTQEKRKLENARILIGKAENSNRDIYWEYGNPGLANRHLLISGKSGQGKTYFMQCILLEKSKLGIPSIIIDYTEGFLPNQLENEFVTAVGNKLKQKIVYSEKLPINPFEKNTRDIGGIRLPESNTDVAERVKSVFASVYKSLGIQQLNAIYEAILNGLEKYEGEMSLPKLKILLEEDGSTYSKTALSQIRPLIDRNPFKVEDTINWKDVIESNGEVFIIQLTGFPRDVQLIITEFVLWDLWNYSIKHGNKNQPMPVIMDEAQNLDHTEKSPSARILTEGRKFGWSAWYATQFLKSQLDADELARLQNSSQKIYFAPPEQEVSHIANNLSKDLIDKKQWENKLATLKKGQCIVHGPVEKENGELSNPAITVVNITPLKDRI
ncbi:DNA phosphorothioation-dependent restriction protein DptH [Metabacillus indicus]|uniref:DNA phosphorothioation-dependent restriction protein DptH n=1 Tax=Metabacillus indicus TaxID=246786 RepID=UPI0039840548